MPDETKDYFGRDRTVGAPGAATPLEDGSPPPALSVVDSLTAANGTTISGRTPSPTSIGTTWSIEGTVDVQDNAMRIGNAAFGFGAWIDITTSTIDYKIDYKPVTATNFQWITFCGVHNAGDSQITHGYRIFINPNLGTMALKSVSAGAETSLGTGLGAFTLAAFNEIRVLHETTSGILVMFLNGTEVLRVEDETPPTLGTTVGVSASTLTNDSGRFDDVEVKTLEPYILDAEDESFDDGEPDIVITGMAFGTIEGVVKITANSDGSGTSVNQPVTAWNNNSVQFNCVKGALGSTGYLFVQNSGAVDSNAIQVSLSAVGISIVYARRRS